MELLPIDFDMTLDELSKWFDKWKVERYGKDSLNPERYYKGNERYIYTHGCGVAEGESINDEKADSEEVLRLLLKIRLINQKLSGKGLLSHLQYSEREQLKRERGGLYNSLKSLVEHHREEREQTLLPDILNNDLAKSLLDRLVQAGYAKIENGNYKWIGTKVLCAYFADKASHYLNLSNTMDSKGNITTSWKPFELLFSIDGLKVAKANWMRLNTKFEPTGFEGIARLFDKEE